MDEARTSKKNLIVSESLKSFFLDSLLELNKKSLSPVPMEALIYSSEVLNTYVDPLKFFEVSDEGKVKQKILGIKLLEAYQVGREEQKRVYKDVGDSALILCGMFNESVNRKILDINYYHKIGKMAYGNLNSLERKVYDYPEFFELISDSFLILTMLINQVSRTSVKSHDKFIKDLINQNLSDEEMLAIGVLPSRNQREN
ncbi:MAG: hypothetical protein ACOYL6_03345 [Bacteriovoracaceae bacterium]